MDVHAECEKDVHVPIGAVKGAVKDVANRQNVANATAVSAIVVEVSETLYNKVIV